MSSDTVVSHHTALPFIRGVVLALPYRVPQNIYLGTVLVVNLYKYIL